MSKSYSNWICFQIGAREHYAIARVLEQQQQLYFLVTDAWVTPQSPLNLLPKPILNNLRERFNSQLATASVKNFNSSLIQFEIKQKISKKYDWKTIINRNQWFQKESIRFLEKIADELQYPVTIFAYSYAALEIIKFAKKQGWQTILGQIDPGIYEEKLVAQECSLYPQYATNWQPAPNHYWDNWHQECELADRILVNSQWSKQALHQTNISFNKTEVVSLAYETSSNRNFTKFYPKKFSKKRPLRILFLGQIILRKGLARILEAIKILEQEAVEFWFVGSVDVKLPQNIINNPKVKWFGSVSRSTTANYYQQADVFLFPTLSDGFGLTQLEAQAWKLPIITSPFCGEVVKNRINGLLLSEVTGNSIAQSLIFCLNNPNLLAQFSQQSSNTINDFRLDKLHHRLQLLNNNKIKVS